MTQRQENNNN